MFKFKTDFCSLTGLRESNEDAHAITNNKHNYLWAIYDGHGGPAVSKYLKRHSAKTILNKQYKNGIPTITLKKRHDDIQDNLIKYGSKTKTDVSEVGSTSLTAIITNNKLQLANVGDCRAVLCKHNGLAQALTVDHKPEWDAEKKRIVDKGGRVIFDKEDEVYRIMDLSVSRAFGDIKYTKYVTRKPDVFNYTLKQNDQFLILACDGLWDVMCTQDAVNFVITNRKRKNVATMLGNHAINKLNSTDNVSIIIIFFSIPKTKK